MKTARGFLPLAVLLSSFLLIHDAYAQFGGTWGGSRSSRGERGSRSEAPVNREARQVAMPDANSYEQIEYRLSLFEEDLKLTAGQNKPWQAFAANVRAYAADLARERAHGMSASAASAGALQHVAQAVDAARNRLAALEEVETAAKDLYQALTPEQKALADVRIPTIVAPRQAPMAGRGVESNLPDLGPRPPPR